MNNLNTAYVYSKTIKASKNSAEREAMFTLIFGFLWSPGKQVNQDRKCLKIMQKGVHLFFFVFSHQLVKHINEK